MNFENWKAEQAKLNEEAERKHEVQGANQNCWWWPLLVIGTILVFWGANGSIRWGYYPFIPMYFGGLAMILGGCYIWVKRKNRSKAWALMGLLAPIGFIVLAKLKPAQNMKKQAVERKSK